MLASVVLDEGGTVHALPGAGRTKAVTQGRGLRVNAMEPDSTEDATEDAGERHTLYEVSAGDHSLRPEGLRAAPLETPLSWSYALPTTTVGLRRRPPRFRVGLRRWPQDQRL